MHCNALPCTALHFTAMHCTTMRRGLTFGVCSPKECGRLSLDPLTRQKRNTAVQANALHDQAFEDALRTASEDDVKLYEEWKTRAAEQKFGILKGCDSMSVRELCTRTLKVYQGLPLFASGAFITLTRRWSRFWPQADPEIHRSKRK